MKKNIIIGLIAVTSFSCGELLQVANTLNNSGVLSSVLTPTDGENVAGLKSALNLGIESAVSSLGKTDGFLQDAVLKVLLPQEAQVIVENIKLIPGGQALVDKAVLSLNRSAEDAVKEATPIFAKAIRNMSISDAMGILMGSNNAATNYLKSSTYSELETAFAPKIAASLSKPLVGNTSTSKTWNDLTSTYNQVAKSPVGMVAGLNAINVNLENYVMQKALDALFVKVAAEETAIRKNPAKRVTSLLQKVFGQQDNK